MTSVTSVTSVTELAAGGTTPARGRQHLYEIDLTRAVTAVSVIGVHVGFYTLALAVTPLGALLQNAAVDALHFTREIFLAITAFVLTYSYANRPFSVGAFWRKRGIGVVLPYVVVSILYEVLTKPALPPLPWLERLVGDLLSGHASWQLYYILLTLEFYLVLPWFLVFIRWAGRHPWIVLAASFVLQVAILAWDYASPQSTAWANTGIGLFIDTHQDRFLPLYQFYIVCGGLAALYMPQVRAWVLRHGALIVGGLVAALAWLMGNYFYQVEVLHQGESYASSVFEPPMALYGLATSAFVYWIALRWATRRAPAPPRGARVWMLLSDISFGIYLVHAYFVDLAVEHVIPHIPRAWPQFISVPLIYLGVVACTVALCTIVLYIPGLSRLIGRPWALRRDAGVGRWVDQRLAWLRARAALAVDRGHGTIPTNEDAPEDDPGAPGDAPTASTAAPTRPTAPIGAAGQQ
jgi:peptidoglycan/LPS O-acetylase OafA/YrhL